MRVGILPLGRPTFDVAYAEDRLAAMLAALDASGAEIVGPRGLLFDAETTRAAISDVEAAGVDHLLLLQMTFTDASMTVEAANAFPGPLSIWAVPEPRLGGRLRLNAFCGLNLASHALGLAGRRFGWLYADPEGDVAADLGDLLAGHRLVGDVAARPAVPNGAGRAAAASLAGRRIARIGEHPVGFDTCAYDGEALAALTGMSVDAMALSDLFAEAEAAPAPEAARAEAERAVSGLDAVDQTELDRSLRLRSALDAIRARGAFDAFAIRCWPETFTEYGGAVCGPVSMMGEARVPCACEADVYGAATQLLLQAVAEAPVFLVDLVDIDTADGTGVVWHCGQAPISMRDPEGPAEATIHTNRKMPLLYEFTLRPGRVTFVRLSQAKGVAKMILATGDVVRRPMAFTGTSGVVTFDSPAGHVLRGVMDTGLEHHMALAYGDHAETLSGAAAAMGLEVIRL